jgi:glycosyltransferase involved in cell wall biosynthesis
MRVNPNMKSRGSERPLVTIGIPTYNRAASTLPFALKSALAQTYSNIEIIVGDNCSSDGTEGLVQAHRDDRVRYIRHPQNIGARKNQNFCVEQARGAYFLMLHDDDLIDPDFVETCMNAVGDKTSYGTIRTGIRLIDGDGSVTLERPNQASGTSLADLVRAWFRYETSPYCCNTLCNTAALKELGGFNSRHNLLDDVLTHVKLAAKHGYINVADAKACFRRHDNNMGSAARIRDWCEDSRELLDTICDLAPSEADELRREGLSFFCLMNYSYVVWLESPVQRGFTYLMVARQFDFALSPFRYAYRNDLRPRLRAWKRRLRAGVADPSLSA